MSAYRTTLTGSALLAACLATDGAVFAQAEPETIELTAVIRDFEERYEPEGHEDFERNKDEEADGLSIGVVAPLLGEDRKPVFLSTGTIVSRIDKYTYNQWEDALGRPICYLLWDPLIDGVEGQLDPGATEGFTSEANFDQWYRDIPGVNMSKAVTLTLVRQADGTYVFDDKDDPSFASNGGFFPIDDQLFGNTPSRPQHNYHFTTEIHCSFRYDASTGQVFRFVGDDDVWVFIDGRLVIDLSGTHNAIEQFVDLSRLGLTDGQIYSLDLFHAERQTKGSNFAFQTNLILKDGLIPSVSASCD